MSPRLDRAMPRPGLRILKAASLLLAGLAWSPALAATLKVPGNFPTIQDAVNAAAPGDEITLDPGEYQESVTVEDTTLVIRSSDGDPSSVVWFSAGDPALVVGPDAFVTLEALMMVRDGDPSLASFGTLTARSIQFLDGSPDADVVQALGGDAFVTVDDCVFGDANLGTATAIRSERGATVVVRDTAFAELTTEFALIASDGPLLLERVRIENVVSDTFLMTVSEGRVAAFRTGVMRNNSTGIAPFLVDGTLGLLHLTLDDNPSGEASLAAGDAGALTVLNSIVRSPDDLPPTVGRMEAEYRFSNVQNVPGGPGVIDADPVYTSPVSLRLDAGSPGIDAADADVAPPADFDEEPRALDDQNIPDAGVGSVTFVDMGAYERLNNIRYVRADAPEGGDGLSWATAFTDLQDGLLEVGLAGPDVDEVWIAAGSYRPDRGTNDRNNRFSLFSGTQVLGGFIGTEIRRDARRPAEHETILTGEIGGPAANDNSRQVVVTAFTDATARLSGVTIAGGYANGGFPLASSGGGLFVRSSSAVFDQLTVRDCVADFAGHAIFALQSDATFDRIRVHGNGGPELAGRGVIHGQLDDSRWSQVQADGNFTIAGATMDFVDPGNPVVDGATIVNNRTLIFTAGIAGFADAGASIAVTNSIVYGNSAASPTPGAPPVQTQIFGVAPAWSTIEFGGSGSGPGVNDAAPAFRDADGPDNIPDTFDDDFRLAAGSPMIDAGNVNLVALSTATDLSGVTRRLDDPGTADTGVGPAPVIDRGAHEFDGTSCPTDVNGDGVTSFDDLLAVLAAFGSCPGCPADIDGDGTVDFSDLLALLAAFGPCP